MQMERRGRKCVKNYRKKGFAVKKVSGERAREREREREREM